MFDFLEVGEVVALHEESLKRYGGAGGLRESGQLDSALAATHNTFLYANGDEFDIAAAYAFHVAESQCFFDGNKRTEIGAALLFLKLNGIAVRGTPRIETQLYEAMIANAKHELDKPGLAALLREIFR